MQTCNGVGDEGPREPEDDSSNVCYSLYVSRLNPGVNMTKQPLLSPPCKDGCLGIRTLHICLSPGMHQQPCLGEVRSTPCLDFCIDGYSAEASGDQSVLLLHPIAHLDGISGLDLMERQARYTIHAPH